MQNKYPQRAHLRVTLQSPPQIRHSPPERLRWGSAESMVGSARVSGGLGGVPCPAHVRSSYLQLLSLPPLSVRASCCWALPSTTSGPQPPSLDLSLLHFHRQTPASSNAAAGPQPPPMLPTLLGPGLLHHAPCNQTGTAGLRPPGVGI